MPGSGVINGGDIWVIARDLILVAQRITEVDREVDVIEAWVGAQSIIWGGRGGHYVPNWTVRSL